MKSSENHPPFSATPAAQEKIASLTKAASSSATAIDAPSPSTGLHPYPAFRIEVSGGGCSGFMYKFSVTCIYNPEDDTVIHLNPATAAASSPSTAIIVIDKLSLSFLEGSQLNHVSSLEGDYFEVSNPNATAKCGCGSSFSI